LIERLTAAFRQEHAEIGALADAFGGLVAGARPAALTNLLTLRDRLTAALTAHLNGEDWVLYPRIRASGDPAAAALADRFVREIGGLSARYQAYLRVWTSSAIAADWSGFQVETGDILAALAARAEREDRELYPLLERPISSRPAAAAPTLRLASA
jgi:hypothetical protein